MHAVRANQQVSLEDGAGHGFYFDLAALLGDRLNLVIELDGVASRMLLCPPDLDPDRIPRGIDDSKRLTPERREQLFEQVCATACVSVAIASRERIDRDNILRASLWALARAVRALPVRPCLVFVDGRDKIDGGCDCQAVIGGDGLVASIAAASIVAKVTRDRLMIKLGAAHPGYGFERHMGYSVPEHFAALDRLGPTVHHRRSFAPVAGALGLTDEAADAVVAEVLPL